MKTETTTQRILDNENCEYYVRFSDHIEEDMKRGWSSWNFGQDGFEGEKEELIDVINNYKESEGEFQISGFNVWIDESTDVSSDYESVYVGDYTLSQLYPNYWVAVDNVNAENGLSAHVLPDNLFSIEDILKEIKDNNGKYDGTGDGESFSASDATVIYSKDNMHIIEVR